MQYIGRGMHLEYQCPTHDLIRTSRIREIRELAAREVSEQVCLRQAG